MIKKSTSLTVINLGIAAYFLMIYLLNRFQIDYVIIGVFRELLTIPFLTAQIFFLIYGFIRVIFKGERSPVFMLSLILLIITSYYTLRDFF